MSWTSVRDKKGNSANLPEIDSRLPPIDENRNDDITIPDGVSDSLLHQARKTSDLLNKSIGDIMNTSDYEDRSYETSSIPRHNINQARPNLQEASTDDNRAPSGSIGPQK